MTGPRIDPSSLLWPDERVVASIAGRGLGAAALRLARLRIERSAVGAGAQVVLVATGQRLVVVDLPAAEPTGRVTWQLQLPRLSIDLHRLPGQLVIHAADRFVAVEVEHHADVGPFLAALATPRA